MANLPTLTVEEIATQFVRAIIRNIDELSENILDMQFRVNKITTAKEIGTTIRAKLNKQGYGFVKKVNVSLYSGDYIWRIKWNPVKDPD